MNVINDLSKYLEVVKKTLDETWLKQEQEKIKKYYNTEKNTKVLGTIENYVNPLALLLYQAETNISERKTNSEISISNESVDIVRLGLYIEALKSNNVTGFEEKLNELKKANRNNFEKIINELNIASGFVKSNHTVKFIETQSDENQRTPDLLIDGTIEVECKKKDKLTSRDIRNNDFWNRLERKSIELMNKEKRFYLIYTFFNRDPDGKIIKKILKELYKIIHSGKDAEINLDSVNIIANKICDNDESFPVGINAKNKSELMAKLDPNIIDKIIAGKISRPDIVNYEKNHPEFDHTPSAYNIQSDGSVFAKGTMKFLFKSKEAPDRLKSIMNSIKNAKGQLSGDRIGIICVNMTHVSEKLIESDYALLGEMIQDILKNNTRISAVAITSEFYIKDKHGIRFLHRASVIRNDSAKKPLPSDFVIMN